MEPKLKCEECGELGMESRHPSGRGSGMREEYYLNTHSLDFLDSVDEKNVDFVSRRDKWEDSTQLHDEKWLHLTATPVSLWNCGG